MPHAMIVDDDLGFQLGFAEAVQLEGFTTTTAATLAQARKALEGGDPDVLFIDLNLPDGSGLDLLDEMSTIPETVLITGQGSVETAVEAFRLGVTDYLTKPVDFARVKTVLDSVAHAHAAPGAPGARAADPPDDREDRDR